MVKRLFAVWISRWCDSRVPPPVGPSFGLTWEPIQWAGRIAGALHIRDLRMCGSERYVSSLRDSGLLLTLSPSLERLGFLLSSLRDSGIQRKLCGPTKVVP